MAKKIKKNAENAGDKISELIPEVVDTAGSLIDSFKKLTVEQQDQILRYVVKKNGYERLLEAIKSSDTPGALELFLDRIHYHHFLPMIRESKKLMDISNG
jgi:hypothetical protein